MDAVLKERFFAGFKSSDDDSCWEWLGHKHAFGYGLLKRAGKIYSTHRLSYLIHKGHIPPKTCVCHSCDNPSCVNPAHLWLGTQSDNQKDCFLKGRRARGAKHRSHLYPDRVPRGESSGRSRLKDDDVRQILRLAGTMSQAKLGEMFDTPQTNISSIIRRKSWKHITKF